MLARCRHHTIQSRLFILLLLMLFFQGCASKYTISSSTYHLYQGEINQHSRLIKADRKRIFHILTDEKSFRAICPKGTLVTHASAPPYQAGSRLKTDIDHIFNLGWRSQVMEVVPDNIIRLQFLDGFFAGGTEIWELESKGKFTQTTHTIIVQIDGFFKSLAWRLKVRRKHDNMVEKFLDNLKLSAEKANRTIRHETT